MLPRRRWQEMTAREFSRADVTSWIAALPVAAIEQHGPHLPVSTDTAIAEGMIAAVTERLDGDLPITFLPIQAYGKSNEHIASPGTLTLGAGSLIACLTDIAESIHRAGLRKLILINSHGGNVPVLNIVAQDLRTRLQMLAVVTAWSRFGQPEGVFPHRETTYGIHSGDIETSMMAYLRPDLVRMEKAADFHSLQLDMIDEFEHLRAHGPHSFAWLAEDLNKDGAVGNAAAATAEKGRATIEHQARGFIALCRDVHAFDLGRLQSGGS